MKKILPVLSLVILVWSCSKKMTPAKSETPSSTNSGNLNSSTTPATLPTSMPKETTTTPVNTGVTGAMASATSPTSGAKVVERPGAGNDAAAIAGQATFNAKCGRCHGLKVASNYTESRWVSIMQVMAVKANLDATEKENVLAYVRANAKK